MSSTIPYTSGPGLGKVVKHGATSSIAPQILPTPASCLEFLPGLSSVMNYDLEVKTK